MNYPIIFSKFETGFSTFGLAVLEKANNVKIKTVVNGEFTLSLILPRNDPKWAYILEENFIMVDGQLFRIRTFEEQRDSTGKLLSNIQCEHVWYDANDCKFVPNFEMIGATPREVLEAAFAGTRFTVGTVDFSLANTDIFLSKTNPAAITNKLIENVGGELERDNYTIHLRARIGNNNGVQFRTGKNNAAIKKTTDSKSLCTRLYPYGVDDLDISSVNGAAYLDSQYKDIYDYVHARHIDYSDIDDPAELKAKALSEFSTTEKDGIDKPKVTIEISVIELKKLSGRPFETFGIGDTVRPIDEDLNIDYNARIMEYEYYPYEAQRSTVVLANFRNNIGKLLVNLADTRNQVNRMTTPTGKVKVAWLENIMAKLQTEIDEGLTKKVAMHDYGDVWVDSIENPTEAMAIVNGKLAIANSKKENGDWNWRTFGTGDGFVADLINAGVIRLAENLTIENEDGTVKLVSTGMEITETDVSRAIIKSGQIALQAWVDGAWVNGLHFDIASKKFVFDGTLSAAAIETIKANIDIVISNTVITQTLYAGKGYIADITVNQLDSSDKVQKYKNGDTSDVYYIKMYGQYVEWIPAMVKFSGGTPLEEQAKDQKGIPVYWADATRQYMTYDVTPYPVIVYQYKELSKMKIGFEMVDYVLEPKIILGAGSDVPGHPEYGQGTIWKGQTGLYLDYLHSVTGELRRIKLTDEGIDFSEMANGKVIYTDQTIVEGIVQVYVDTAFPDAAKSKDVLIKTDDYSRYDRLSVSANTTTDVMQAEFVEVTGTSPITLTLSSTAASAGCIKKIKNSSSAIVTLSGTIDGKTTNILYPSESVELIWNGTDWRAM